MRRSSGFGAAVLLSLALTQVAAVVEEGSVETLTAQKDEATKGPSLGTDAPGGDNGTECGRIAYWWGKVNLHTTSTGAWTHDTDCKSGASLDPLTYCRKFWPFTASVQEVPVTKKPGAPWYAAGCGGPYAENGQREFLCKGTLSCKAVKPAVAYQNHPTRSRFRKDAGHFTRELFSRGVLADGRCQGFPAETI